MLNTVKHFCQEVKNWKTFLKSLGNKKRVDQMFEIGQLEILKPQKRDKSPKHGTSPNLTTICFLHIFLQNYIIFVSLGKNATFEIFTRKENT